jgi:hypothetical protein
MQLNDQQVKDLGDVLHEETHQDVGMSNTGLNDHLKEHGFYTDINDDLNLVHR